MDTTILNSIFTWVGIIAAFLSAFSFLGTWWTGKIIDKSKTEQIEKLQLEVSNSQPTIFSQASESLNIPEGNIFKQTYRVSINSPSSNMVIFTYLTSTASRVGGLETTPTNNTGVRINNGMHVPFQDFLITFNTDRAINPRTDKVEFDTKSR